MGLKIVSIVWISQLAVHDEFTWRISGVYNRIAETSIGGRVRTWLRANSVQEAHIRMILYVEPEPD